MAEADESQFTQKAVKVFRECTRIPSLTSALVVEVGANKYEVVTKWRQRELERGKEVSFTRSFFVEKGGKEIEGVVCKVVQSMVSSTFQSDATNQLKVSHAPQSGMWTVLVKEKPTKAKAADEPQQYIEVWSSQGLVKTVAVSDLKKHGKIHEDSHFGSFQLSSSGKRLLYIAEKDKPKPSSFFKKTSASESPEDGKSHVQGAEHVYEDHWGEQLSSVVDPIPVVMSVESEECVVVDVGDSVSAGQAVWVPGEKEEVVYVGWENKPRKLGFVYCLNRPSAIYHAHLETGKITALTGKTHCVYSPRFSPQGDKLVYFEALGSGPHHSCAALKMISWRSKEVTTVVDVVSKPEVGRFPGFYSVWLPEQCWDSAGTTVLCSETWGSLLKVVQVDVGSGDVRSVSGEEKGAWSVMCVSHNIVVAQHSSPSQPPRVMVGVVSSNMSHDITWTELSPSPVSMVTEGVSWEVLSFQPEQDTVPYEAILVKPRPSSSPPPLAVIPHGGPHVAIVAEFMMWPLCLVALGTAVLLVNYRGSTGYGQDGIQHLLGKIGRSDVDDVQQAAEEVVRGGGVDGEKVCVMGGSHGGFLALHLIGQYPEFYKAASVRNPVVDLAGMRVTTDIPDWTYVESGMSFDPATPPNSGDVSKLLDYSPIVHSHKIKAAVLVLLGADDLRVPPSQGRYLYHTLRAMGKETKLHVYPGECHPLSSVHCDGDCFVNTVLWLYNHGCCTLTSS